MSRFLVQVRWWGVVDGYPSTTWKTIEEHEDETNAQTSADEWNALHGKTTAYRVVSE